MSLRIERSDDGVALAVTDTWIGIDAAVLHSLCHPVHQVDASINRKFSGSGLGLAISRKPLAMHEAMLTIESTLGRGTTLRAGFPCQRMVEVIGTECLCGSLCQSRNGRLSGIRPCRVVSATGQAHRFLSTHANHGRDQLPARTIEGVPNMRQSAAVKSTMPIRVITVDARRTSVPCDDLLVPPRL